MRPVEALEAIRDELADACPDWIMRWPECFPDDPDPFTVERVREHANRLLEFVAATAHEALTEAAR